MGGRVRAADMMPRVITLFFVSLMISAFTFGGGYAMIPIFQNEYSIKRKWITENDIIDIFALAQSMPGVLAVNSSLLIGYKAAGFFGAAAAALGIVLPSLAVMSLIAVFYAEFAANTYISGALCGMSAAVAALMLSAVLSLRKQSIDGAAGVTFAVSTLAVCLLFPNVSAVWLILAGGVIGTAMFIFKRKDTK
jgi:chromate transporter